MLADAGSQASTILYLTLLLVFAAAIITTVITKWSRDKCLKLLHGFHVTLVRPGGITIWGRLKVFSSGIEVVFDHPYIDPRGLKKSSYMIYQQESDQQLLCLLRYHDELTAESQRARLKQVHRSFNPGPIKRALRGLRNIINTLRDAFTASMNALVGQVQRTNPAAILAAQGAQVTQLGSALITRIGNTYEPLLEQYLGQPVILDILDPSKPGVTLANYSGYLAEYTSGFIALFNVQHETAREIRLKLPDFDPAIIQSSEEPLLTDGTIVVRIVQRRLRIENTGDESLVVQKLHRAEFEPFKLGVTIPSRGMLELPVRDARGGELTIEVIRCVDIVAPRKFAVVRHAGELVERRGLIDELHDLPLVPQIFQNHGDD